MKTETLTVQQIVDSAMALHTIAMTLIDYASIMQADGIYDAAMQPVRDAILLERIIERLRNALALVVKTDSAWFDLEAANNAESALRVLLRDITPACARIASYQSTNNLIYSPNTRYMRMVKIDNATRMLGMIQMLIGTDEEKVAIDDDGRIVPKAAVEGFEL